MNQDKFLIPLELESGETLLELLIGRIRRNMGVTGNAVLPVPIIFACNSLNRDKIESFLKERGYCGLEPSKIRYLQVPMMPIMDPKGKLCMTFEFKVIEKPSGTLKCV